MVAPSRFCHVVYRTRQFEQMVDWYLTVFEGRIQARTVDVVFITYDEEHHRVAIKDVSGQVTDDLSGPGRVAHVAYAWDHLDDLLGVYKRLRDNGILPVRPTRHGLTLSLYYQDPDGNGLEFQMDLLDIEAANEYMTSDEFLANPSGDGFDPEELLTRYEAGEAVDSLIFRPEQPERMGSRYIQGRPQPPASLYGAVGTARAPDEKSMAAAR
jgi:catechol 2,3-dioxygenase-like lactoylglutathione lyase family enzyme